MGLCEGVSFPTEIVDIDCFNVASNRKGDALCELPFQTLNVNLEDVYTATPGRRCQVVATVCGFRTLINRLCAHAA